MNYSYSSYANKFVENIITSHISITFACMYMEHENLRVFPRELSTLPKIITQSQFQLSPSPPCSCSNYSQCISKCWLKVSWHSIYFRARHAHTKSSWTSPPAPIALYSIISNIFFAGGNLHPFSVFHFTFSISCPISSLKFM